MYAKLYRHRDRVRRHRRRRCPLRRPQRRAAAQMPVPDRGGEIRGLALRRAEPGAAGHPAGVHHQEPGRHHLQRLEDAQQERGGAPGPGACAAVPARARPRSTRKAGTWFDDREIYEWFAANLHRVREPSLRHYVRARELKAAGMDWTDVLAAEDENRRARLAAELLASAAYGSTAERVKAFVEQGGGCRATFFNYRRKLGGGNGTGDRTPPVTRREGFLRPLPFASAHPRANPRDDLQNRAKRPRRLVKRSLAAVRNPSAAAGQIVKRGVGRTRPPGPVRLLAGVMGQARQ